MSTPDAHLWRDRLKSLLANDGRALTAAAARCDVTAAGLEACVEHPILMPLGVFSVLAEELRVPPDVILRGVLLLDAPGLVRSCYVALGRAALALDPVKGGVTAGGDPERFATEDLRQAWMTTIAGHLAELIGALYLTDLLGRFAEMMQPAGQSSSMKPAPALQPPAAAAQAVEAELDVARIFASIDARAEQLTADLLNLPGIPAEAASYLNSYAHDLAEIREASRRLASQARGASVRTHH